MNWTGFSGRRTYQDGELARLQLGAERLERRFKADQSLAETRLLVLLVERQSAVDVELASHQKLDGRRPQYRSGTSLATGPVDGLDELFGRLVRQGKR